MEKHKQKIKIDENGIKTCLNDQSIQTAQQPIGKLKLPINYVFLF